MSETFDSFGLRPALLQAIEELGFKEPTPIQSGLIPVMMTGQDVIGQAQTGTGKTAAFALPMLQRLQKGPTAPQGLVVAPTRELAQQVADAVYQMGKHLDVSVLAIYGGQSYGRQLSRLRRGVDIVAGTPGRLLDLIDRGSLDLSQLQTLVFDEADEMLSMGFIDDIEKILQATPESRQTALFSATMPAPIRKLSEKYLRDPHSVTIERQQVTAATITQSYYLVNQRDKSSALMRLFEIEPITRALIFARTRVGTGELANELTQRGLPAEPLNGDLSQQAREHVLNRFRRGQITVLVATDVAARGLDIDDVSHVFNYDLPQFVDAYVHRVGRTGRGGKSGVAISLVTPRERGRLRRIEQFTKQRIDMAQLPTIDQIQEHRETELMDRMRVWLRRDRYQREKAMIETLSGEGYDHLQIASAALKMARANEKKRPIAEISPVRNDNRRSGGGGYRGRNDRSGGGGYRGRNDRGSRGNDRGSRGSNGGGSRGGYRGGAPVSRRSHESGMVRLVIDAGREQGVRPGAVVQAIASTADIPGSSMGAIKIDQTQTFVDIPESLVGRVLENGAYRLQQHKVKIVRAN